MKISILYKKESIAEKDVTDMLKAGENIVVDQLSLLTLSGKTGINVAVVYHDIFGRNLLVSQYGTMQLPISSYSAEVLDGIDGGLGNSCMYDYNGALYLEDFEKERYDCVLQCDVDMIEQTENRVNLYMGISGSLMAAFELNIIDEEEIEVERKSAEQYHIDMYELEKVE